MGHLNTLIAPGVLSRLHLHHLQLLHLSDDSLSIRRSIATTRHHFRSLFPTKCDVNLRHRKTMQEALQIPSTPTAQLHLLTPPSPTTVHFRPPSSASKTSISPKLSPPPSFRSTEELQEKLIYLDSFEIDLIPLLTTHPPLLSTTLSHLKSTVSFLSTTILLPQPAVRRLIYICPQVLTLPLTSIVSTITFLLREAHVHTDDLHQVIHRRPRLLTSDVKTRLRPTLYFLQGTIGISGVNKHTHLLTCSVEDKFLSRIEYFHEIMGISYKDTILMFRRFPSLFCYSIKDNIEPKFKYLAVEMGRELREMVEFPQYFSFSLEKRIDPRHRRCVERGVCLPLPMMLRSSERRFRDKMEV
ncbi:transcription termination factor MTEF1, chloroplastic-like [Cynara cardunculus var. scolymus]|uniref:Mitochodrial transcription termination factor-related protein n=1 Tax=Cynara cardunculus var. scolymus TaxID=59895 RepID=A0A103YFV0_CYNCS|nr:transcription termination factor MTEF1, chloroplastic-like [Cynara cardunculus var. scolymus]KVI08334.1 Mitochodrial transcription termination factor-related protein [Cynara cardunculus var. scolymus]